MSTTTCPTQDHIITTHSNITMDGGQLQLQTPCIAALYCIYILIQFHYKWCQNFLNLKPDQNFRATAIISRFGLGSGDIETLRSIQTAYKITSYNQFLFFRFFKKNKLDSFLATECIILHTPFCSLTELHVLCAAIFQAEKNINHYIIS